jgi:acetyl esterase/lipase
MMVWSALSREQGLTGNEETAMRFRMFRPSILGLICCASAMALHAQAASWQEVEVEIDLVYGRKVGMALTMDRYTPGGATGAAVLFVNSGGFESGKVRQYELDENGSPSFVLPEQLLLVEENFHYPPLEQFSFIDLLDAGITVFDVRHGSSPKFTLDEIVEDILLACAFVRDNAETLGVDADRLGLAGASAGGYLAAFAGLTLGRDRGIQAIATFYPAGYDFAANAREFPEVIESLPALQIEEELLDELSLRHLLTGAAPPILILYGSEDFPFITSACQALDADLRRLGAESKLVVFEGTGHEFRGPDGYDAEYGLSARKSTAEWFAARLSGS